MTPVGHAAVAYTASVMDRRLPWAALVVGGVLPDIDFALLWSPAFNALHRVVTHNLAFVAFAAVLAGGWVAWRARPRDATSSAGDGVAVAVAMLIGGLLHLLVDSVMDGNPSNGIGVAFLWPVTDITFSPFNVVTVADDPPSWHEPVRMIPAVLAGVAYELPFYASAAVVYFRRRTAARGGPARRPDD